MNTKVKALQLWLNAKGMTPPLVVDGKGGPATRDALIWMFTNTNADSVTPGQLQGFADRLGWTVRQLRAVSKVESGGSGYFDSGLPKILWERHYFWRRLQIIIPLISNPAPGGYTTDADHDGINDSWEKLAEACCTAPGWAFESASWGKFQIMGAWWKKLGYSSAIEFAWSMRESEVGHYEALVRYVEVFGLKAAGAKIDGNPINAVDFAYGYNGKGFAKYSYDSKIAAAWRTLV